MEDHDCFEIHLFDSSEGNYSKEVDCYNFIGKEELIKDFIKKYRKPDAIIFDSILIYWHY